MTWATDVQAPDLSILLWAGLLIGFIIGLLVGFAVGVWL